MRMRNQRPEYGFIKKEWDAKKWILITLTSLLSLLMAFMIGEAEPDPKPLGILSLIGAMILGVGLFSRDEYDPARSFIYQLPISRSQLLTLKLRALAGQIGGLFLIPLIWIAIVSVLSLLRTDSYLHREIYSRLDSFLSFLALWAAFSLALTLLAAIVSLHIRSVIVALVVTPVLAAPIAFLIELPHLIHSSLINNLHWTSDAQRFLTLPDLGWVVLKLGIVTVLLGGWLFFVFCKTRLRELNPTPRALLVFLFGIAAVEVVFTLFYTGWRDLAWLVFGI